MRVLQRIRSTDNMATKYLQETNDGNLIETAYVDYYNKHIICFSTLIGCPIGCKFCTSGQQKYFVRRLTDVEIFQQCWNILTDIDTRVKPVLFTAMGEGEPILNLSNVMATFETIKQTFPAAKFALSTSGFMLAPIRYLRLDERFNLKLQFSLHAANQELRSQLIPKSQPLGAIKNTLLKYASTGKPVEINYILLGDVNDSMNHADELYEWCAGTPFHIKINQYNTFFGTPFKVSENTDDFIEQLQKRGAEVEYYQTNGTDINAACGQMSANRKEAV